MPMPQLKSTLMANALFSTLCGIGLLVAPVYIAQLLGHVPIWLCLTLGIGLLIFALDVIWITNQLPHSVHRAKIIFFADVAWVLITPILLTVFNNYLSEIGRIILVDIAVVVALLAWLEWAGLRKLKQQMKTS